MYAIKSKCSRCSVCFGFIDNQRDVAFEMEEQKFEIEKGLKKRKNISTIESAVKFYVILII